VLFPPALETDLPALGIGEADPVQRLEPHSPPSTEGSRVGVLQIRFCPELCPASGFRRSDSDDRARRVTSPPAGRITAFAKAGRVGLSRATGNGLTARMR
jgi:hypothetical protein